MVLSVWVSFSPFLCLPLSTDVFSSEQTGTLKPQTVPIEPSGFTFGAQPLVFLSFLEIEICQFFELIVIL